MTLAGLSYYDLKHDYAMCLQSSAFKIENCEVILQLPTKGTVGVNDCDVPIDMFSARRISLKAKRLQLNDHAF